MEGDGEDRREEPLIADHMARLKWKEHRRHALSAARIRRVTHPTSVWGLFGLLLSDRTSRNVFLA